MKIHGLFSLLCLLFDLLQLSRDNGVTISPKLIKEILKEARIMRRLRHPNIVTFVGVVLVDHPLYIILEYVQGGALDSYLRKNKDKIKDDERLQLALGVAWGMEYLHKVNILHRDIAARNCLYDKRFTVGLICHFQSIIKIECGIISGENIRFRYSYMSCILVKSPTKVYPMWRLGQW
ncbi:hypothetical protein ANCDUO_23569 [Ancylostoma duodenale]|uniref:Protein kinase domain-containing protein n=1 Tax=Ancylostoma duodenale TaxID=51022 RepID=A0A0C2FCY7_9BILA|nr:hypothetical protein ANCDUO_23569 [Ancylostoma duodenale]